MNPATGTSGPITLSPGHQLLVITRGRVVRAEQRGAWGRLERVWPRGRMLEPVPGGGARCLPGWSLPGSLRWTEIFTEVPPGLVDLVARFQRRQWSLLEFAHNLPAFRDLLHANPALAYSVASLDEFRSATPEAVAALVPQLAAQRQREIAGRLGFPATAAAAGLLRRVLPEAANPSSLRLLRAAHPVPAQLAKLVSHLPGLNAGVLAFMTHPALRELARPELLAEVARHGDERAGAPTADLLLDVLRMGAGVPGWTMPPVHTRDRAREVHARTLLQYRAERERLLRTAATARASWLREARMRGKLDVRADLRRRQPRQHVPFPDPPVPGTDTIRPLTSEAQMTLEGAEQRNCADSYVPNVEAGEMYLYRMSAPERATLSVVRAQDGTWMLHQIKAKANAEVVQATLAAAYEWLEANRPPTPSRAWEDTPF